MHRISRNILLSSAPALLVGAGLALTAHRVVSGPAPAGAAPAAESTAEPTKPVLTLVAARAALDAAIAEAGRLDAGGAVAVVDDGGHLVCLTRIDGTFPAAAEVATLKAATAAKFRRPTKDFEDAVRSGRTTLVAVGPVTPLEGGVPLRVDGQVVGAIGVSGAHSSAEDVQIATAGAAALAMSRLGAN